MTIKHVLGDTLDGRDVRRFVATVKRKKQSKKPKIPKSTKEVEKSLREIVRKERFVEGGDLVRVVRNDCIMIACEKGLKLSTDHADHVFGDGTFQYAPKHFKQMFTLHVIKDNIYVPVLYFLLKNKQQRTNQSMFKVLKEQCPTFNPKVAHFHFEVAIHNAFLQVFPGAASILPKPGTG